MDEWEARAPQASSGLLDVVLEPGGESAQMCSRLRVNQADRWTVIHRQRAIAHFYI